MPKRLISREKARELYERHLAGATSRALGRELGCSYQVVREDDGRAWCRK